MKRHTGERPHSCEQCGKSFIQATQLRNHLKTHIRPFKCTECSEKFKTQKQLDRHVKEHSVKRRRKPRCLRCQIVFPTELDLQNHVSLNNCQAVPKRTRKKERTDCAVCEKKFDSAKSLHFHILKVHEADPEDFVNEKLEEKKDETDLKVEKIISDKSKAIKRKKDDVDYTSAESADEFVEELILDEVERPPSGFTIIHLESDNNNEAVSSATSPLEGKTRTRSNKRGLAESLAAAIADNDEMDGDDDVILSIAETEEDMKLKKNIGKLLDMLVESDTLKKFRWPEASEEEVLCKVIENCGHDLSNDAEAYSALDYATRMRVYVKLLFTVVIHNDSIKELLNNYPIDEVIEYVLGTDDDEDEDEDVKMHDENVQEIEEKIEIKAILSNNN